MTAISCIVIQAGGRGSRMDRLSRNKPKPLVPVNNLPIMFHLFRKYPSAHYVIIGDYKFDVLSKYLHEFAPQGLSYQLVNSSGHKGTCSGLNDALALVPENSPFMLIWCDLILPPEYQLPELGERDVIGISKDFPCRWMYEHDTFTEQRSDTQGVAGHFIFRDKSCLAGVPQDGEFVRWLQENHFTFTEQPLYHTREYGLYSEWAKLPKSRCRPFNKITRERNILVKEGIDAQGLSLAKREAAWYRQVQDKHFTNIPEIYSYDPLRMEFIDGRNIYEYTDIPDEGKRGILRQIISCLRDVHKLGSIPADRESYYDAYLGKTWSRLQKVRNLAPFAHDEYITINGRKCRNIFFCQDKVSDLVMQFMPEKFVFIHGDCTFSNTMLRSNSQPVLIDPRGYFGKTEIYGDPAYDWGKLYYSLISNYDQFNLKRFDLAINEHDVTLSIASNNWEGLEDYFFELLGGEVTRFQMKILLALVWLSLTTYAWEDYDSICGAYYNGLLYLDDALSMI